MKSLPEAVCAVITNPNTQQILVVSRKDDPTSFGLPGGKVDPGETKKEAICREIKEETGLTVIPEDTVKVYETLCPRHAPEGTDYYAYAYLVSQYSGHLETQESGIVKWGSWNDLYQGSFAAYNVGLKNALDERGKPMLMIDRLVGMPEEDATKLVETHHMRTRVTFRDGNALIVTADLRTDRVNLSVVDGVVTQARVG